nr:hypothetical protein Iba_chr04fCG2690 [Ipomoea batatas]
MNFVFALIMLASSELKSDSETDSQIMVNAIDSAEPYRLPKPTTAGHRCRCATVVTKESTSSQYSHMGSENGRPAMVENGADFSWHHGIPTLRHDTRLVVQPTRDSIAGQLCVDDIAAACYKNAWGDWLVI